jgi:parvulin-like peptidyl-prolyl isomerase
MFVGSQFQMSLPNFKHQQMREVLADRMRKIIENSVQLFPGEARESYEKSATWVKVESATFDPTEFAKDITPTQADVKRWAQANEAMIEDHYKKNEFRYKNVEKQVRLRNILIKVPADAADEVKQEKKALADDVAARAAKGEDFAALAKAYSEDEQSRAAGGDNGFKGKGVFEEVVEDAAFGMKPGEVKGPLETLDGYQILKVEDFREGTIPLDDVRLEIAEQIMVETRSSEQAKSEAEKFLALVKAGDDFGTAARKIRGEEVAAPETAPGPAAAGEGEEGAVEKEEAAEAETPGVWQPVVRTSSEIGKDAAHIPGVGPSKPLVAELFALAGPQTLLPRVVEVNGKFHILRVKERHEGSDAEYLAKKDALERELLGEKRLALVEQWIDTQRKKAEKEGAIEIQQVYLKYPGDDTKSETGD